MSEVFEIELTPEKKLFYSDATSFGIYAAGTEEEDKVKLNSYYNFTIKGKMPKLELGVKYKAKLEGVDDPKYGWGYNVHSIFQEVPVTVDSQKAYLNALLTELQVDEIYKVYPNENVIELIRDNKFDFKKVKGIGSTTYERIRRKVIENLEFQELFSELGKYGITYDTIKKLIDEFGSSQIAIQRIKDNPYELTRVHGISFKKADVIARNMGIALDDPHRVISGIKHVIEEEQFSGHTYIKEKNLLDKAFELLAIDREIILANLVNADQKGLYVIEDCYALQRTYNAETNVSQKLHRMLGESTLLDFDVDEFIEESEAKHKIKLSDQQKSFFLNIKKYNVNLLIGYAGCGKSMLQRLLIDLLEELGYTYKLLAPTGKAAKVLSAYTKRKAYTVHKAIGYGQNKAERDMAEITEDFIVIDEASMLDVFLASMTLNKINNPQARILFVGDAFQLPSVSCGNLLHDMVSSKVIPTTKLDIVFRQSEGGILDICTKVRLKEKFIDDNFIGRKQFGNNLMLHSVNQQHMTDGYKYYYKELLKKYKPEEILVLSPKKSGELGTVTVNKTIQSIVNPEQDNKKELVYHEDCTFRIDDYIINTKNNYDIFNVKGELTELVNGDTGRIIDIVTDWKPEKDMEEEENKNGIVIDYDFDVIRMPLDTLQQLLHSWCITKHKSQGSSAKAVLVILDKSHKFQANANLLYTAITRAVDECVILCQAETINFAMRKVENLRRNTFLESLLRERLNETTA